jgi:hypothetical protein
MVLGLGLMALAGCNFDYDSHSGVQGTAGQSGAATDTGTAELAWQMPTENTNGTPLTDLAGYTIVYGPTPGSMDSRVHLTDIGSTSYVINGLGQGTWYFAVLSYTVSGADSALSNIVSKTIF